MFSQRNNPYCELLSDNFTNVKHFKDFKNCFMLNIVYL